MKKQKKRLLGILLAVLMVFSLIPSAFAEDGKATIKVENPVKGHTYTVYRIFTGTYDNKQAIENLDWAPGVDPDNFLKALSNLEYEESYPFAKCASASDVARVLEQYDGNSTLLTKFAETAYANTKDALIAFPRTGDVSQADLYKYETENYGYCLVVDSAGNTVYATTLQNIYPGATTVYYVNKN